MAKQSVRAPRYATAILRAPSGRYIIVGSVPVSLAEMAWDTEQEAIDAIIACGVTRFQGSDCRWITA